MRFQDIVMAAATQGGGAAAAVGQYVNGGDFASAVPWTLSTPASSNISGGKLNFTSAAGVRRCYQASLGTYATSNVYRVSGVVSGFVDGGSGMQFRLGADANGLNGTLKTIFDGDPEWPVANGPFSVDITLATLTGQNHTLNATAACAFSVDNFSIVPL